MLPPSTRIPCSLSRPRSWVLPTGPEPLPASMRIRPIAHRRLTAVTPPPPQRRSQPSPRSIHPSSSHPPRRRPPPADYRSRPSSSRSQPSPPLPHPSPTVPRLRLSGRSAPPRLTPASGLDHPNPASLRSTWWGRVVEPTAGRAARGGQGRAAATPFIGRRDTRRDSRRSIAVKGNSGATPRATASPATSWRVRQQGRSSACMPDRPFGSAH